MIIAHLIGSPIGWLNDPFWAKVTIILALTWRWTGYNMVFFLVGLQSIDTEIYEAAEVDGASKARQFFKITMPLLLPVILFSAVTSTNGTMQLFDEPNILTTKEAAANGTLTAALYLYRQAFMLNSDFGYATALSYIIVLISGFFAFVQIRFLGGRDRWRRTQMVGLASGPVDHPRRGRHHQPLPLLLDGDWDDAQPQ